VGIFFTQVVVDHSTGDDADLLYFYGSLARSLLSLFEAFTGGADWDLMANALIEVNPAFGLIFAMYIAFAVLAMMNVVTGVFVESALATARDAKDIDLARQLREIFRKSDEDHGGNISWEKFESHLEDNTMTAVFNAIDVDQSAARALFELIDIDGVGVINQDEFILGCLRLKGQAKAMDLATLMYDTKRLAKSLEEHMHFVELVMMQMCRHYGWVSKREGFGSAQHAPLSGDNL
jgi:hypothetical protein